MSDAYPITPPPTQDELPWDDNENMETERHRLQMELLIETLQPVLRQREGGGYVGGNMFVYYSLAQVRHQDFKGPDVFVVLDVPAGQRKSWVVWEEGKSPDVIIELLSPSTAEYDKGAKKRVYESQLKAAEYYWYDPFDPSDFAGFALQAKTYTPIQADTHGNLHSQTLGLHLTRWAGRYRDAEAVWLRWMDTDGRLLPTGEEIATRAEHRAAEAEQRADSAEQRANSAEQLARKERERAERLAARMRALGIDLEDDV